MSTIQLAARFYDDGECRTTLSLDAAATALMLVDCDGDCGPAENAVIRECIAPALVAARAAGLKVLYFQNAPGGEGGPNNISRELHGRRRGRERLGPAGWKPCLPTCAPAITPLPDEPQFQKAQRNGFCDTFADGYLRTWGVIFAAFSRRIFSAISRSAPRPARQEAPGPPWPLPSSTTRS